MGKYEILKLTQRPELKEVAAAWFNSKWGVPIELYQESMSDSLKENAVVPSWYLCLEGDKIIGGLGVIQNDFHNRKDLAPNICAVFTERCILKPIIQISMKDMVGSFWIWFKMMENLK